MKNISKRITNWFVIFFKSVKFLKAIKVLKALKAAKIFIAFGTMLISLFVYGSVWGWLFGIGLTTMLFVHEIGHVIAMKMKGHPVKAPIFIPFFGAFIFAPKKMERSEEAFIGIGGPLLGTLGAIIAWFVWFMHPSHPVFWLVMSFIGLFINLFNMIPLSPLDGGRITQAVGPWFKWVGIIALLILTLALGDPGLLLIWVIVIYDMDKLPMKTRTNISLSVLIIMLFAIVSGVGSGERMYHWFDFGLAFFYVTLIFASTKGVSKEDLEKMEAEFRNDSGSARPQLNSRNKLKWFLLYAFTTTVLLVSMFFQSEQIKPWLEKQKKEHNQGVNPQIAKKNIEEHYSKVMFFFLENRWYNDTLLEFYIDICVIYAISSINIH